MASSLGRLALALAPLVAAALTLSAIASAEPSAADKETARALMTAGRQDRTKGDLQAALKAFAAADAIMRVPTTGMEVARSQVALGLLVEAHDTALQVMRLPVLAREPAPFRAARDAAASLSEELLTRIPSLTVTVKNVPEGATATVTIDGASVSTEALDAPRKLNPGHHVVTAKAGSAERKQDVELAEQETKSVAIELPAPEPGQATNDESATPAPREEPAAGRSSTSKALIVGGFGVGGVGLIVGSITGVLSLAKTSSIKGSPACAGSVCNPSEDGDLSSARTMATVSTVSFIAAGTGAVVGLVGLFTGRGSAPPTGEHAVAASVRLEPTFGVGSVGVRGEF
jgi:hypothetical protein